MLWRDRWVLLREGLRLALRSTRHRLGAKTRAKHSGTAEEICRAVVEDCWNGSYFCAGLDHLDQFWMRDLAICLEGLIDLGQDERARQSLRWALEHYDKAGRITTTIFPPAAPLDVFTYSSDSLPFLLYCLERLEMTEERARYAELLRRELGLYELMLIDPLLRQIRGDRMFSGIKDTTHFVSSCYSVSMVGWCAQLLERCPELESPLDDFNAVTVLNEWFWTGSFFRNDLQSNPPICSADANFWPFWCGLVDDDDHEKLKKSVETLHERGLDEPMPLKYHNRRFPERELQLQKFFLPNYQGDAIWTFFSAQWIELVAKVDRGLAEHYLGQYCSWLESYGTWIEVFDPGNEAPLKGRFGHGSDWGMLWAASLPRVLKKIRSEEQSRESKSSS